MHEFIRLLRSFASRHLARPKRYSELNSELNSAPDGLDLLTPRDLSRIQGAFAEATKKYIEGAISYEQFRAVVDQRRQTIYK